MAAQFRILFAGAILEGFELAAVKVAAGDKLKANPAQVDRLFSGKRAVLKKNLPDDKAQQYFRVLRRIGMDVTLEQEESQELELEPIQLDLMAPTAETAQETPPENYDPEKTLLSNPALAAGLLDTPSRDARASLDDLPSLDPDSQVSTVASSSHEATMIVSPKQAIELMPQQSPQESPSIHDEATLIVSRDDAARMRAQLQAAATAHSTSDEATLIVSPSDAAKLIAQQKAPAASPHEATMIVNQSDVAAMLSKQKAAASNSHEETLVVSPSMVKQFVAEQKAAAATPQPAVQPPAQSKPPAEVSGNNTVLYFGIFLVVLVSAVALYLFW
ncbi:hypothetical protein GCM10025770_06380 [Viridibacterium curvum]|uniref:Uncharacterized protein n=2 Tax=Viridibacterium curvum TaxID=1101404 RepID=A0ABP9QCN4_9RHOO